MAIPEPSPGLVVRYDYLWSREAAAGRIQGKERPACLVVASDSKTKPRFVVLLPITHSPPLGDTVAIEIPPKIRQAIGLDDAPSWVVVSEYNVDEWPNAGLAPVPGRPDVYAWVHSSGSVCADQGPACRIGETEKERSGEPHLMR